MPRAERRRTLLVAVGRGLGIATVLTVAYFSLPLNALAELPFAVIVLGGVIILAAVIGYQMISIFRAVHPAAKAVEALCLTGPLFLLLFASTYFLMSQPTRPTSTWPTSPAATASTSQSPSSPPWASATSSPPVTAPERW
jgi:hypothetical protein